MKALLSRLALGGLLLQLREGRFDILSALVGAALAGLLGYLFFRFRGQLGSLRGLVRERAGTYQTRAMRGHEARYRDGVVQQANQWHLGGFLAPLERVGVLPRFLPVPRPYDPRSDAETDEIEGPLGLVPLVMDYPHLAGIYNLPGIDIPHVLKGAMSIALLGEPGSGRSTALAMMAIVAGRQSRTGEAGGLVGELRIPVLVHLGDVDLSPELLEGGKDPAEILLAAALKRMSGAGARSAPGIIPPAMAEGLCLVLADGWDELPPMQRARTLAWFNALRETYPDNRFVVAAPARGFSPLLESGFTPVYLQPWSDFEFEELAVRWAEAWQASGGSRRERAEPPDPEVVGRVARGNRSRTPLDVTLKAWAAYSGDEKELGRQGWYDAFVDRILPVAQGREALERLASEALVAQDGEMLGRPVDEVKAYLDASLAQAGRLAMDTPDFLYEISAKRPILVERVGNRYAFVHPVIEGFLATGVLAGSSRVEYLRGADGALAVTMPFLAEVTDVSAWVGERLGADPEVLYDNLLGVAVWASNAQQAPWHEDVSRRLAQGLLSPSQFPVVRERILSAMVASRDPNIVQVFRQGLQAENPVARMLSALGLGAVGSPDVVPAISDALEDVDITVQIAGALALTATRSEESTEIMVHLLFEGSEPVRRAVAEALAADAQDGHPMLREAMTQEDVMVRRAAIYGLARVAEPWAIAILEDRQIEDDQWFVRDAAREALERFETDTAQRPPQPYPAPDEIQWLIDWAAGRGEAVPPGQQAVEMLVKALQEGDDEVRYAAADALGKLGSLRAVKPLYAALRDSSARVRDVAYQSLARISQAVDKPLPAVV